MILWGKKTGKLRRCVRILADWRDLAAAKLVEMVELKMEEWRNSKWPQTRLHSPLRQGRNKERRPISGVLQQAHLC